MKKAPDFTLKDADEQEHTLSDYKDKIVVIYFYPKDNTPGCTLEAIDFSKLKKEFEKYNAVILGISKDNCASHQKFIDKQKLTITLLSDPDHKVMDAYGVWKPLKFMGREYLGTQRSTFLIKNGHIIKEWPKVTVKGHAQEVLEEVKKLNE
ncbi:thioredoxin-dependent thiol peroxidase [Candidatus Woesearchaeota archaeon]|nr:MAG: thioredoxin-dependent thiol peroxidase [Candidatus Woesearchaeota archaeon]